MTPPTSSDLSVVIGRIYDCALDPTQWEQTLAALWRLLHCRTAELSASEGDGNAALGEPELELLRLLIPHLRRAATISNALDAKKFEAACLSETLDALRLGVVLTNEEARIVHANRAARTMMRRDGPLRDVEGVMRAARPPAAAKLQAAVTAACHEAGLEGVAVRLDGNKKPVVAYVFPLTASNASLDAKPVAAMLINAPLDEVECARALASTFKLTGAETRMLIRMLAGKNLVEAAVDAGVAMTTARTHLNRIFAKTGVSRQSDLIRLAAAAAPVIPDHDHPPPAEIRAGGAEKRVDVVSFGQPPIEDFNR